jgi:hypothetical protein
MISGFLTAIWCKANPQKAFQQHVIEFLETQYNHVCVQFWRDEAFKNNARPTVKGKAKIIRTAPKKP